MENNNSHLSERNIELHSEFVSASLQAEQATAESQKRRARRTIDRVGREFFKLNEPMVTSVTKKYANGSSVSRTNAGDYASEANIALWKAFTEWDPSQSPVFATWAWAQVENAVRRAVSDYEYRDNYTVFTARSKVKEAEASFAADGVTPTVEELAEATGLTTGYVKRALNAEANTSLDAMLEASGDNAWNFDSEDSFSVDGPTIVDALREKTAALTATELACLIRTATEESGVSDETSGLRSAALDGASRTTMSGTGNLLGISRQGLDRRLTAARAALSEAALTD